MTDELKKRIMLLAQKYEVNEFLNDDPSRFMHRYSAVVDKEVVAFLAANLAFGNRKQILSHIEIILSCITDSNLSPREWILSERYKSFCENDLHKTFYRMYTYQDLLLFFDAIRAILQESESLGNYFRQKWLISQNKNEPYLHQLVAKSFPKECALISHCKSGAAKKLNMLLRWLVRDNSPVDLGLWKWYDKKKLLIPLDTHVMSVAHSWGLIKSKGANLKTAIELTDKMRNVFPDDPVKADFALFGLGVNTRSQDE